MPSELEKLLAQTSQNQQVAQQPTATPVQPVVQDDLAQHQETLRKLNQLQAIAPTFGYDGDQVNEFVTGKQKEILAQRGVSLDQIQDDPDLLRIQTMQALKPDFTPPLPESEQKALDKKKENEAESEINQQATQAYVSLLKDGSITNITAVPAENRSDVVKALSEEGIDLSQLKKRREGQPIATLMKQLYEIYTQGTEDQSDDLSGNRVGGQLTRIRAALGLAPQAGRYSDLRQAVVGTIKGLTGDTGVMTDKDAERLIGLLPRLTSTNKEAEVKFKDVDEFLKGQFGGVGIFDDESTPAANNSGGSQQAASRGVILSDEEINALLGQ